MRRQKEQLRQAGAATSFFMDPWILLPVLALMAIGLLMVASASMAVSDHYYSTPFHFVIRQSIYLLLALAAMWAVSRISSDFWQKNCFLLLAVSLLCLLLVLVPGIGRVVNGSRRWIAFPFFTFQVSEFAKLVAILFMANYISRYFNSLQSDIATFVRPLIVLAAMVLLLLLEPDFGTVAVIMLTALSMLFLAGAPFRPFLLIALLVGLALLALVWFSPYRFARLVSFLDPWSKQFGSGYQLTQSLIAFGRGGIAGVGLGNSMQKLFYLPEAHTDFLFAVLGEELGLVGAFGTLLLYGCLVWRIFLWAGKMVGGEKLFAGYFCYGVGLWLAIQAAINMGVTVGLLPTKGLTLPFISYGGTSLVVSSAAIGLVLRLVAENRVNLKQKGALWERDRSKTNHNVY
jgi:cell division protein FtsW